MSSVRDDILTTLETDLVAINGTDPYDIDLKEIKRGIAFVDDFNSIPAISFWCYDAGIESRQMGGSTLRWLKIYFYGYAKTVSDIHDLEDDLEYFLENEFVYRDDSVVQIETSIPIYEGGTTDNMNMFRLDIKIKYDDIIYNHLVAEDGDYLITE